MCAVTNRQLTSQPWHIANSISIVTTSNGAHNHGWPWTHTQCTLGISQHPAPMTRHAFFFCSFYTMYVDTTDKFCVEYSGSTFQAVGSFGTRWGPWFVFHFSFTHQQTGKKTKTNNRSDCKLKAQTTIVDFECWTMCLTSMSLFILFYSILFYFPLTAQQVAEATVPVITHAPALRAHINGSFTLISFFCFFASDASFFLHCT